MAEERYCPDAHEYENDRLVYNFVLRNYPLMHRTLYDDSRPEINRPKSGEETTISEGIKPATAGGNEVQNKKYMRQPHQI